MNNRAKINTDGVNIYVTLMVKSHRIGQILTSIFVLALFVILVWLIAGTNEENLKEFVFPILVFGILIFVFPVRYLIWNILGKENLIINTKTISHNFDYGIYQTNLKTVKHNRLAIGFEQVRLEGNVEKGNMVFYDYKEEDNLPFVVYQTSVLLDKKDADMIDAGIRKIYEDEFNEKFDFFDLSPN